MAFLIEKETEHAQKVYLYRLLLRCKPALCIMRAGFLIDFLKGCVR